MVRGVYATGGAGPKACLGYHEVACGYKDVCLSLGCLEAGSMALSKDTYVPTPLGLA